MAAPKTTPDPKEIKLEPFYYKLMLLLTIAVPLLVILGSMPFIGIGNGLWLLGTATILIGGFRWKPVRESEYGGITALNIPAREVGSGWHYQPLLCAVHTMPKASQQYEFPDEPENVSKRRDAEGLKPNEVRPMRITVGPAEAEYEGDPLNTRQALEISTVNEFRLKPKGFFELWINIPGETWEEKLVAIRQRLRDSNETELMEELAKRSPPNILKNVKAVNAKLKEEIQEAVEEFGVEIIRAKIKSPDFPVRVNEGLADIAVASTSAIKVGIDAAAEKGRLVTVSEGERQAGINKAEIRKAELAAEGEGLAAAAKSVGVTGAQQLAAQVARDTIGEADMIIGLEGASQAIGLGKAILKAQKPEPEGAESNA